MRTTISRFVAALVGLLLGVVLSASAAELVAQDKTTATAVFAGGCFWCMEPPYDALPGVVATTSGFTGGQKANPSYKEVSGGNTGHIEAVQITYDPAKVSYEKLLEVYWRNVDPLDGGGQFCDRGHEYTTAIFYQNEEQKSSRSSRRARSRSSSGVRSRPSSTRRPRSTPPRIIIRITT